MDFCQHVVCLVPQTEGKFRITENSEENAEESIHNINKSHTVKQREPLITIQRSHYSFLISHQIISCPSSPDGRAKTLIQLSILQLQIHLSHTFITNS